MNPLNNRVTATAAASGNAEASRRFLSAEEVGRQLGLKRSRVYELATGPLPAVRRGKRARRQTI
jgi:hypothetical protein